MRHKIIRLPDKVAGTAGQRPAKSGSSRPAASKPTATAPVEPAPSRPPADRSDMADNSITLVGNVTRDPELRFTTPASPRRASGSP